MRWRFPPSAILMLGALVLGTSACQKVESFSNPAALPSYERSTLSLSKSTLVVGQSFTATFTAIGPSKSTIARFTEDDVEFVISDTNSVSVDSIVKTDAGVFVAQLTALQAVRGASIRITLQGTPLTQIQKTFSVLSSEFSAANSTLTRSVATVQADGLSSVTLTLTVRDINNSEILDALNVSFETVSSGTSTGILSSPVRTQGTGIYTASFVGRKAGTALTIRTRVEENIVNQTTSIQVLPGPAANFEILGGNNQSGAAGSMLATAVQVKVTDIYLNTVPGQPVIFTVAADQGLVIEPDTNTNPLNETVATNAAGIASARWVLPSGLGVKTLTAALASMPTLSFKATSVPGPPSRIEYVSGDAQTAAVGKPLPQPLIVRVLDVEDNPVPGATVRWTINSGNGAVSNPTSVSGSDGRAQMNWTMGTRVEQQELTAQVPLTAWSVSFVAVSGPGPAARVTAVSGNDQVQQQTGTNLPELFIAEVQDSFGNAVVGAKVKWLVTVGGGSTILADTVDESTASGRVSTRLTLGPVAGLNAVTVTVAGSSALFTHTSTPRALSTLVVNNTLPISGPVGGKVTLRALARDNQSNPIPNLVITWEITVNPGGAALASPTSTTNSSGIATMTYTLGTALGANNVRAFRGAVDANFSVTGEWDVDLAAYLLRDSLNVTMDDTNKLRLHNFVIGLKEEGIWPKIREMWFLRSAQNTTVANSVLGFINTNTNGTTLGAFPNKLLTGIGSDGTGPTPRHIDLGNTARTGYSTRTFIVNIVKNGATVDDVYALTSNNSLDLTNSGEGFKIGASVWWGRQGSFSQSTRLPSSIPNGGVASMLATSFDAGRVLSYLNGASILDSTSPRTTLTDTNNIRLMANYNTPLLNSGLNGEISFAADFNEALSANQIGTIYDLYRATAGQCLDVVCP